MATITPSSRSIGRTGNKPDEEFLQQLYRGGELLAQGKVIEARDYLERAHKLQPRNEKGQNLLGLAYFKLGLFDRAADIYEALVRENPADPTLRVNLGLVYLKTNALQRAIREFETATDLSPDHKKAQNYLGLALAQASEYGRAREHFLLAGSEAMAEKMSRAIAGESFERPPQKPLAKQAGFAEVDGHDVVAERGGEQVGETSALPQGEEADIPVEVEEGAPASTSALAHQDWAAGLGGEEASATALAPVPEPATAVAASAKASLALEAKVAQVAAQLKAVAQQDPAPALPSEQDATAGLRNAAQASPAQASMDALPSYELTPGELQSESATALEAFQAPAPELTQAASARKSEAEASAPGEAPAAPAPTAAAPAGLRATRRPTSEGDEDLALPISSSRSEVNAPLFAELVPAVQLYTHPLAGPFQALPEVAAVVVRDELLTRLTALVTLSGSLSLTPEHKRSRGRATEKPFGEGDRQLFRARGQGVITVDARGHTFLPVDLADEPAYFREEVVFAFEEPVMFENGRLNAQAMPDLDLVHLRGKGQVLLQLQGPLRSIQVAADRPVTLPLNYLVGWYGNLAPRLVPLGIESPGKAPSRAGVELSGEGFALFAVPV